MNDQALDAIAALLRSIGQHGFDMEDMDAEQLNARCEGWARHVLIGEPAPGGQCADLAPQERCWGPLRSFVREVLRRQQQFVTTRLNTLREVLGDVVKGLRDVLSRDQAADQQVNAQLERLIEAIRTDSIDLLRQEALNTVTLVGRALDERKQHQREQMEALGVKLQAMRSELLSAQKEMTLDPLSRLFNRAAFDHQLEKTVELSLYSGQQACLIIADIDHFKTVNDTHGHPAGDAVIRALADCLVRCFPRRDDFVARYAGDEFAIILNDSSASSGELLARRLMDTAHALVVKDENGDELRFTLSVGLAPLRRGDTAERWLHNADSALYAAKRGGRARLVIFQ